MSQHVVHEAACPRARVSTRSVVSPHALPRRPRVPARGRFLLPIRRVSLSRSPRCAVPSLLAAPLSSLDRVSPHRVSPRRSARCVVASRCAALLAGPFPSLRRPARCVVPLAVPPRPPPIRRVRRTARRAARCRSAFTHPTRWHSVSARSGSAQRAITPRQWNRYAITPRQFNRRAETPQQRSQRAETPQQRHHGPPADAYEPLAKRTSQELRPDLGC